VRMGLEMMPRRKGATSKITASMPISAKLKFKMEFIMMATPR
jgi:hypothetical protein